MSLRLRTALMQLDELRHEPIDKRIRAVLDDRTVVDTTRALLVWEPKRVVPSYAVPIDDVAGDVAPDLSADRVIADGVPVMGPPELLGRPVYDPSVPFAAHTTGGSAVRVSAPGSGRWAAGFRPADADLSEHVVLDFDGFDTWLEEDEPNVGHPRDPFHRIDVLHSSRHVRVELHGAVLADTTRSCLLFEPPLPVRYYLPPDDVVTDRLRPSETVSTCAYKGHAAYWSAGDDEDIAWTYREPLHDALEVAGRIAFFNELVDLVVDDERLPRPVTPWSRRR